MARPPIPEDKCERCRINEVTKSMKTIVSLFDVHDLKLCNDCVREIFEGILKDYSVAEKVETNDS
jgi:hypothetical protein